jgi:hypothetical protein
MDLVTEKEELIEIEVKQLLKAKAYLQVKQLADQIHIQAVDHQTQQ